ncbi:hypothetical protein Catovirus_1_831 [Catovirus CTV1]|uniref:Uncharacterized protein n=1 Tax=Catovirus CTV1 TaxID=1977631 RepID=A0A1V0SAR5_9VIRU|nr:hypothetical protein Catovirus_1_831 [Catovirus CTV1]
MNYIDKLFTDDTVSNEKKGQYYLTLLNEKKYYLTKYIELKYCDQIVLFLKKNIKKNIMIKTKYTTLKNKLFYRELFDTLFALSIPVLLSKL